MRKPKPLPDQKTLDEIVVYYPETGELHWKNPQPRSGRKPGARGTKQANGSLTVVIEGRTYMIHRLAWKIMYGTEPEYVLHLNACKSDNRISNLTDDYYAFTDKHTPDGYDEYIRWSDRRKKWGVKIVGIEYGWYPCRVCAIMKIRLASVEIQRQRDKAKSAFYERLEAREEKERIAEERYQKHLEYERRLAEEKKNKKRT